MRRNLKDLVAARFRDAIFSGEFAAGQRIDQDQLAERWEVSRLPIREALISLENEGLVRMVPRRGAFIAALNGQEIINHYHVYGLISAFATELAAPRLTEDDLAELSDLNDRLARTDDDADLESLNFRFHQVIGRSTGSDRVRAVLRTLGRSMPGNQFTLISDWRDTAHKDHVEIYEALRQGDAAAASRAMLEHLDRGGHAAAVAVEAAWRRRDGSGAA